VVAGGLELEEPLPLHRDTQLLLRALQVIGIT